MSTSLDDILKRVPDLKSSLEEFREIILANLVMIGEIPAPTFKEKRRINFLIDRFDEAGLVNSSVDQVGNGVAVLEGEEGDDNILLVGHADTVHSEKVDHTITVDPHTISGAGVADNSLGLAIIASLPVILEKLDISFNKNILFMGATRSLGRGNLEGLRFFLDNNNIPISAGVSIEGVQIGRLSHVSIGMLRGEISCSVPEEYDWSRFGDASAILTINDIINKINDIPLPKRPRTSIVLGSIEGGTSYNNIATQAKLQFEIRSESADMVDEIGERIDEITAEVESKTGDVVKLDIFAKREPGGIKFTHPLIRNTRKIMQALDLHPRMAPSTSELSAFIYRQIPAITLGITKGDHLEDKNETIEIAPIFKGVAQLIGTLLAIDGGYSGKD